MGDHRKKKSEKQKIQIINRKYRSESIFSFQEVLTVVFYFQETENELTQIGLYFNTMKQKFEMTVL